MVSHPSRVIYYNPQPQSVAQVRDDEKMLKAGGLDPVIVHSQEDFLRMLQMRPLDAVIIATAATPETVSSATEPTDVHYGQLLWLDTPTTAHHERRPSTSAAQRISYLRNIKKELKFNPKSENIGLPIYLVCTSSPLCALSLNADTNPLLFGVKSAYPSRVKLDKIASDIAKRVQTRSFGPEL